MRTSIATSTLIALIFFLAAATPLCADPISIDGGHDIGVLLERAGNSLDLDVEDAVILLERFETLWTADGRLAETTHRVVLIRTSYGLNHFADLRIPWDSARQKLTVDALRTWRLSDKTWITTGATAVVETLPYAVDRAPDYCHLRESMLLHDGVELPCVLETSWTVEDTEPFRPGASGTRSLALDEPALISQFVLTLPAGVQPVVVTAGGAPQPATSTDSGTGLESRVFEMTDLPALPHPHTEQSILLQPRVSWSTWKDWNALTADLDAAMEKAVILDDDVREALNEKLEEARSPFEAARLVAGFVGETTRLVNRISRWWPEPRPATRTWATAYGHRVDRTVLAAALYREVGFTARLAFRGTAAGEADVSVPGLHWSEGVSLLVSGKGVDGWFNPESARFVAGGSHPAGRTTWVPAAGAAPEYHNVDQPDRLALRFDLAFDGEKKVWSGTGVLEATGSLSPFHRMSGLGSEAKNYLSGLVGSILGATTVNSCNPERFGPGGVTMGFDLEVQAGEKDELGRLATRVESLPSGLHVDLYAEARESDVYLSAPLDVQIELHLNPGDLETVHLPEPDLLVNGAGLWQVESSQEEDKVVLLRQLQLTRRHYPAAQWPELRTLLLAENNRAGRVMLFK